MTTTTHAIVFVLSGRLLPDADRCIQYCIARGYEMSGVIRDNWEIAMQYLADGRAEVLVVADERSFVDRTPRVEVAAHAPAISADPNGNPKAAGRRNERTHLVRRTAEE